MTNSIVKSDINETTIRLAQIICRKYEENTSGALKGYLVMDDRNGVIAKNERKRYSAHGGSGDFAPFYGSVKCSETKPFIRTLKAILIAYSVRNNLMEMFRDFPFQKFEIELESYPKYDFKENSFWKYHRTEDDVSFLKIDMKW